MNILFGILVIVICTFGLSYLIGCAVVDRDDYQLKTHKTIVLERILERIVVGMQYIGYICLVVVFIVGLIFGVSLLGGK